MGSWSVYCGISKITISSGDNCVLLPIKPSRKNGFNTYLPYLPTTLPIFGEYNDYGGLENIKKDENTKLIEEYFNIPISEFVELFTTNNKNIPDNHELKDWKYMFIDYEVYSFMISHINNEHKGDIEFGNPDILKLIGFEYLGEDSNQTRYVHKWKYDDVILYSDGSFAQINENNIYKCDFSYNKKNSLRNYINIPEDKLWIFENTMWTLWKYLKKSYNINSLSYIIGHRKSCPLSIRLEERILEVSETLSKDELIEFVDELKVYRKGELENDTHIRISDIYINKLNKFGDGLSDLITLRQNMYSISACFEPYIECITPQYPNYKEYDYIKSKMIKINEKRISE
ncbi:MAG: hypothetical protein ACOCVF_03170 [bacterium]